jgi:hypothetical protein
VAHGVRVEIENCANALKGIWPVWLLVQQPLPRLAEEPTVSGVCGEAVLLNAADGIVEDGHHEAALWCDFLGRVEVLRRQNHVRLNQVTRNSR